MAPVEEALRIENAPWSDAAEAALTDEASRSCLAHLKLEVQQGISTLWRCRSAAGELWLITRLDKNPTEWVMCLAVGRGLAQVAPQFIRAARDRGWPMRVHTESPAVARLLRRYGFAVAEFVLRQG